MADSPIERMIDAAAMTCCCCGARRGRCECWDDGTPKCQCDADYGCAEHCPNCAAAPTEGDET
jgi:hypothetical protein